MESQDIRKATVAASTSRSMTGSGEAVEEMDTSTTVKEDNRDQLEEEEEEVSSSASQEEADSEELGQTEECEVDSVTSSSRGRAKKDGAHIARRRQASGRSLNK